MGSRPILSCSRGFWSEIVDAAVQAFSDIGTKIVEALYNGVVAAGERIKGFLASLIPDWAKNMFPGSGGAQAGAPKSRRR